MTVPMEQRNLGIIFPPGRDPHAWAVGHSNNMLPDRWPYGLDGLQTNSHRVLGLESSPLRLRDKGILAARLAEATGRLGRPAGLDVSLAWEEQTAIKMICQYPAAAMFSGVIWATDLWERGDTGLRASLFNRLLSRLTGLWCLSRPQVEATERHTKNRVAVDYLPFGVDHNFFTPDHFPERQRILSIGVDRDRDPNTLLSSLEIVHQHMPQVEILVQTESRQALPDGVTRLERVPHSQLRDLYRDTTVVLVSTKPNLHASGMTVALEAGASGRPVVACATPGMEEYVVDGHTGRLVSPQHPIAMADAVLEILSDRTFAENLGRAARRHIEASHTSELMMDRLGRIITKGVSSV